MLCEMCHKSRTLTWVVVDDSYEVKLCKKCIEALTNEPTITVERIDMGE